MAQERGARAMSDEMNGGGTEAPSPCVQIENGLCRRVWAERFQVSEEALLAAVEDVGPGVAELRSHFARLRAGGGE